MVRLESKVFYCPKCHDSQTTDSWAPPMCPKCSRPMKRDTTGREGVFVKP